MPSTAKRHATSPATRPAKITPITETPKLPVQQLGKLVDTIRQNAKDQLESRLERFLKYARPEEVRFMDAVLADYDNISGFGEPESPLNRQLPIFNAIQQQMNNSVLIEVQDGDLVFEIEHFIAELTRRDSDRKRRAAKRSEDAKTSKFDVDELRAELEVFQADAGTNSIKYMRRLLARWSELSRDPAVRAAVKEGGAGNMLMAAAEIESGRLQAENAVERALAVTPN